MWGYSFSVRVMNADIRFPLTRWHSGLLFDHRKCLPLKMQTALTQKSHTSSYLLMTMTTLGSPFALVVFALKTLGQHGLSHPWMVARKLRSKLTLPWIITCHTWPHSSSTCFKSAGQCPPFMGWWRQQGTILVEMETSRWQTHSSSYSHCSTRTVRTCNCSNMRRERLWGRINEQTSNSNLSN